MVSICESGPVADYWSVHRGFRSTTVQAAVVDEPAGAADAFDDAIACLANSRRVVYCCSRGTNLHIRRPVHKQVLTTAHTDGHSRSPVAPGCSCPWQRETGSRRRMRIRCPRSRIAPLGCAATSTPEECRGF